MADLLIKNTTHWMDTLTVPEVQDRIAAEKAMSIIAGDDPPVSAFEQKYNERYERGDVIEVGPDYHWQNSQHGGGKFLIIRCPFLSVTQAQEYMSEIPGTKRRRYRMWFETITDEQKAQYARAPYVYALASLAELQLFGQDKVNEWP